MIPLERTINDDSLVVFNEILKLLGPPLHLAQGFSTPWWLEVSADNGRSSLGIIAPPTRAELTYRAKDVTLGTDGLTSKEPLGSVSVAVRTATAPPWYILSSYETARVANGTREHSELAENLLWGSQIKRLVFDMDKNEPFTATVMVLHPFDATLWTVVRGDPVRAYSVEGSDSLEFESGPDGRLLLGSKSVLPLASGSHMAVRHIRNAVITLDSLETFQIRGVSDAIFLDGNPVIPRRWHSFGATILGALVAGYLALWQQIFRRWKMAASEESAGDTETSADSTAEDEVSPEDEVSS